MSNAGCDSTSFICTICSHASYVTPLLVVFSKTYCPFCKQTKDTIQGLDAKHAVIELDTRGRKPLLSSEGVLFSCIPLCLPRQ